MARSQLRQQFRGVPDKPDEDPVQRCRRQDTARSFIEWQLPGPSTHRGLSARESSDDGFYCFTKSFTFLFRCREDKLKAANKLVQHPRNISLRTPSMPALPLGPTFSSPSWSYMSFNPIS